MKFMIEISKKRYIDYIFLDDPDFYYDETSRKPRWYRYFLQRYAAKTEIGIITFPNLPSCKHVDVIKDLLISVSELLGE